MRLNDVTSLSVQHSVGHLAHDAILECSPATTVAEAARQMHRIRHGSIIVVDRGQAVGIWTERDALNLDYCDAAMLDSPISQHMSSPVKTILDSESIQTLTFRFESEGIRHLLVIDELGNRVGVVSQTDVVNNQSIEFFIQLRDVASVMRPDPLIITGATSVAEMPALMRRLRQDAIIVDDCGRYGIFTESDALRLIGERKTTSQARQAASFPLLTVPLQTNLYKARGIFSEHQVRHLGVMDGKQMVGLLSYADIMLSVEQAYLRELQQLLNAQSSELFSSRRMLALAQEVADSSLQAIMITGANGLLESVNPAFTAITGYSPGEVIGQNPRMLTSNRHDDAFFLQMYSMLDCIGVWNGEIWNRRKNDEIYPAQLKITVVRGEAGEVTNYVGILSDRSEQRRYQEDLQTARSQLDEQVDLNRLMLETLPITAFIKDANGRYVVVNDRTAEFFGFPREKLIGCSDLDIFPFETAECLRADDRQVLQSGSLMSKEIRMQHRGAEHFLLVNKRAVTIRDAHFVIGASVDITARKRIEQRLEDERIILHMIARGDALSEILDTLCVRIERYLHGGLASVLLLDDTGLRLRHCAAPGLAPAYSEAIDGLEIGPSAGSCGAAAYTRQRVIVEDVIVDSRWECFREVAMRHGLRACWSTPILTANDKTLGTFAIYYRTPRRPNAYELELIDSVISLAAIAIERARSTEQLHRMATIDQLTGIPNRRHFLSLGTREVERGSRSGQPLTLCMIDIDNFKRVNDTHGHATGDAVLKRTAGLLAQSIRTVDVCGRLGGEEFVALLPEANLAAARQVAERLREDIARTRVVTADNIEVSVTISVGICQLGEAETLEQLMIRADQSLYAAKHAGRNQVVSA
ncbi:MAG: diguanylate cyclase [Betaproteobacteria bacterium]|nr:diguanylate cyclase [Betaproteobacteria bacterium]